MINKVDRPDARIAEVVDETYELFLDLDADEKQIDFPIVYASAKAGRASTNRPADGGMPDADNLEPLFKVLLDTIPPPSYVEGAPLQALVTNLDASPYLGRLALVPRRRRRAAPRPAGGLVPGRRHHRAREDLRAAGGPRARAACRSTRSYAGDIAAVAGIAEITIGETLADVEDPKALPVIHVDDPSISMTVGINTSPLAGQSGKKLTARLVKNRLEQELVGNVSLRVDPTERPDTWEVQGRGELQLAILVEMMRREGFELTVGKPQVVTREIDGKVHEPVERLTIDVPEDYLGVVTQLLGMRKGRMEQMVNHGTGWVRLEFLVPGAGADRLPHRIPDRDPWHGTAAPRLRALRAMGRRGAAAPHRIAGRRPHGTRHRLRADVLAGARDDVRRPRHRGLRGHDRR